jgi:hypothetical protein
VRASLVNMTTYSWHTAGRAPRLTYPWSTRDGCAMPKS